MPHSGKWTDDLSVRVAPDCTLDELVDYVLASDRDDISRRDVLRTLTIRFGLSYESARLSLDRVHGGRSRAMTSNPVNEPDPIKDPVAYISYHRACGRPAPPTVPRHTEVWENLCTLIRAGDWQQGQDFVCCGPFPESATPAEKEAAQRWCLALSESSDERPATNSDEAALNIICLTELTAAAQPQPATIGNLVRQAGTILSLLGEAYIRDLGEEPYAEDGTNLWFSAIKLSDGAWRLAVLAGNIGDCDNEARAFRICGRITTRLLGHCPERFGPVMVAHADCLKRTGKIEEAVSTCEAVALDFQPIVERWESPLLEENEIVLDVLLQAIDFLRRERGALAGGLEDLRLRCMSLLDRNP